MNYMARRCCNSNV